MLKMYRRDYKSHMSGTIGCQGFTLNTLELPWKENKFQESCIPDGEYRIAVVQSAKFGTCVHILGVSGRSGILIHSGNTVKDTKGCILVGIASATDGSVLRDSKTSLRRLIKNININSHRFIKIVTL